MKLGFGLITCQRYPTETRSDDELYADALDLAVLAEQVGFDSVWVSEHHFVDDGYLPSLLPMCAAIAARTTRVQVGTALLLAPLHDPLRLAEDASVVDLLSRGRLVLGLGLGWREEEFEGLGIPIAERVPRLKAAVASLRRGFAGEPVSAGGAPVVTTPRPARKGGPRIWIGALTEPAIRRAGRIADGLMATEVTPASLAEQVRWALEERERSGGDLAAFDVGVHLPTFPWKGPVEEAWSLVAPFHRYVAWKYDDMEGARGRAGSPPAPPAMTPAEEAALREGIVIGTPEEVAERVRAFGDAVADLHLHYVARLYWPGMDPALQREVIHLWGEEVAPLLR